MTALTLSEAISITDDAGEHGHIPSDWEAVPFGHDPRKCEACLDEVRVGHPERRRRRALSEAELEHGYRGGLVL